MTEAIEEVKPNGARPPKRRYRRKAVEPKRQDRELAVLRLENPAALLRSEVASVFIAAFGDGKVAEPQDILKWLFESLNDDLLLVHLVRDATPKVVGFSIVFLPGGPLSPHPHVGMLYAPDDDAKQKILSFCMDDLKQRGYTAVTGVNRSHLSDDLYEKAFSEWTKAERFGSYFTFHFKG